MINLIKTFLHDRPGIKGAFITVCFICAPLLVLEPTIRLGHKNLLQRFESQVAREEVNIILVGSSRVSAAIDGDVLAQDLSDRYGRIIRVANLGRGYSTPFDKYFAFREIFSKYPSQLKNTWLLIEAPLGVPAWSTWDSPWVMNQELGLLSVYIKNKDFQSLLSHSKTPPSVSAQIIFFSFLRTALLFSKVRDAIQVASQTWHPSWIIGRADKIETTELKKRLKNKGGILPLQPIENQMQQSAKPLFVPVPQTNYSPFDQTVWASVIKLATQVGIKIAFFRPPMCSSDIRNMEKGLTTELLQKQSQEIQSLGFPIISPQINFPDSDYPDSIHLAWDQARTFTLALGKTIFDTVNNAF